MIVKNSPLSKVDLRSFPIDISIPTVFKSSITVLMLPMVAAELEALSTTKLLPKVLAGDSDDNVVDGTTMNSNNN